jgi:protein tyrosine phosphatase (PTP) superfamily phosphohydrolase (DUF442 family)
MKISVSIGTILLCAALTASAKPIQQNPQPPAGETQVTEAPPIPKYSEPTPAIGTGGQPTEAGMKLLAEKGYRSIVNFRTTEEMAKFPFEEKMAADLGMKYFLIPVQGKEPKEAQAQAFLNLMQALKGEKTFVHCAGANRAGALMMIDLVVNEGMDLDKAESEARKIGMSSENLRLFARDVISKQKNR